MKRDLLLCFDAFGTLFRPRVPVHKQYAEVARKYGVNGFNDEELAASFKKAFQDESKEHPNYGRTSNLGSTRWWTNVIERTFFPFIPGEEKKLPPVLAPSLLHRFSSKEGYEMYPDATKLFRRISDTRPGQVFRRVDHHEPGMPEQRMVVGIITNSDDRVPDILSSFGLTVKPLRHGEDPRPYHPTSSAADIDFAIMSYDVGHEKPEPQIFDAASSMLKELLLAEGHPNADISTWRKVYVGDDLRKDAEGAADAGWDAVFVNRENSVEVDGEAPTMLGSESTTSGHISSVTDLASVIDIISRDV